MKGKVLNFCFVNDGRVIDYYVLIVMENLFGKMEMDEQVIYELIVGWMLEVFFEKCVKDVISVMLECVGLFFMVKGFVIKFVGWCVVFVEKEDGEDNVILFVMQDGDILLFFGIELLEKQIKFKLLYMESSLFFLMEIVGKELENVDLKVSMKDMGIGMFVMRVVIIEMLFFCQYIVWEKKNFVLIEKGFVVYNIIWDKKIVDVEMMGMWENMFVKIESGEMNFDMFCKGIEVYVW